jgi:HSP20 family protein
MSNMIRWEPMRQMMSMRNMMDNMMQDLYERPFGLSEMGFPTVDLVQTEEAVIIKATLPGIKPDDLQLSVTGETLTMRGEIRQEEEYKEATYHIRERNYGTFSRSITLPVQVVSDQAKAEFENGVLTLTLPKAEEIRPKTITVKAK